MRSVFSSSSSLRAVRAATPIGWLLLALAIAYLLALTLGSFATGAWLSNINEHGHSHLYAHGHPFVDARSWLGIPNAADTLSNVVFAVAALLGWRAMRGVALDVPTRAALHIFWLGLLLTAFGSGVYHAWPSGLTLVLDRLGMAVAFAGIVALALQPALGAQAARRALPLLLVAAPLAAILPWAANNVLPWLVVQFGGVLLLVAVACMRQAHPSLPINWWAVIGWYGVAKLLEMQDAPIYELTQHMVSGHTLKHVAAACAAWPVISAVARQGSPTGAAN